MRNVVRCKSVHTGLAERKCAHACSQSEAAPYLHTQGQWPVRRLFWRRDGLSRQDKACRSFATVAVRFGLGIEQFIEAIVSWREGFMKYEPKPDMRGKRRVARVPAYNERGEQFSHFDLHQVKKDGSKKGRATPACSSLAGYQPAAKHGLSSDRGLVHPPVTQFADDATAMRNARAFQKPVRSVTRRKNCHGIPSAYGRFQDTQLI